MTFQKTFPKRIKTTDTKKPNQPNYELKNPLKQKIFITKIEIIPSYVFAENGKMMITVNDVPIFDTSDEDDIFTDVQVYNVPLESKNLERDSKIKIFAWNDFNSDEIACTINITLADELINPPSNNSAIGRSDKNRGVTGNGTLISADGGSGIVATAYTCPTGKKAKVKKFESRISNSGSATLVRLLIRGQRMITWNIDSKNPNSYDTLDAPFGAQPLGFKVDSRKIWSEGSFPEANTKYVDFEDEELDEGETIAFDGNFSSNYNATVNYAYTILETRKV